MLKRLLESSLQARGCYSSVRKQVPDLGGVVPRLMDEQGADWHTLKNHAKPGCVIGIGMRRNKKVNPAGAVLLPDMSHECLARLFGATVNDDDRLLVRRAGKI